MRLEKPDISPRADASNLNHGCHKLEKVKTNQFVDVEEFVARWLVFWLLFVIWDSCHDRKCIVGLTARTRGLSRKSLPEGECIEMALSMIPGKVHSKNSKPSCNFSKTTLTIFIL